jgi:hypothetical protein
MERNDSEAELQHTTDELEHDIHKLEDHIDEAERKAERHREQMAVDGADTPAGDVSGEEGGPMFGEDPEGADEDAARREAQRER